MTARILGWGAVAAAAYAVAAFVSVGPSLRPVFNGLAPPSPYNYVNPPPDLEADNLAPAKGMGIISFTPEGSVGLSISTEDFQAVVIVKSGSFSPQDDLDLDSQGVLLTIEPQDPASAPLAPEGLILDGNVYEIEATYTSDGTVAALGEDMTVVLRYPVHGRVVLREQGPQWTELVSDPSQSDLQIFATTDRVGRFITAGEPQDGRPWIPFAAVGLAAVAGIAGFVSGRRKRTRNRG